MSDLTIAYMIGHAVGYVVGALVTAYLWVWRGGSEEKGDGR